MARRPRPRSGGDATDSERRLAARIVGTMVSAHHALNALLARNRSWRAEQLAAMLHLHHTVTVVEDLRPHRWCCTTLADLGLSVGELVRALVAFNVGVEAGQLMLLLLVLPPLFLWRERAPESFRRFAVRGGSIVCLAAGLWWTAERVADGLAAGGS